MTNIYNTFFSRLFHQWRESPNILKKLVVFSSAFQDTNDAIDYFLSHWGIDEAEGALLDLVGQLIGVTRPLAQEDPNNIFTLYRLGEVPDLDGSTGFYDDSDPSVTLGGYMTTLEGLPSITDPGAEMSDADYRFLIRQKSASYRKKATRANLFAYLLAFGGRCLIDDDTKFIVEFDPVEWDDFNEWAKNYIVTRGFKPGGITVRFAGKLRHSDSI